MDYTEEGERVYESRQNQIIIWFGAVVARLSLVTPMYMYGYSVRIRNPYGTRT